MVKVDGIPYEAGSESHVHAVERHIGTVETARDAAVTRADAAEEKLAALETEHARLKKDAEEAGSQASIDSLVQKRVGLVDRARKLLGDAYKWAGKTDRQIMGDALRKAGRKVGEDATDDYLRGAFDHAVDTAGAKGAPTGDADGPPPDDEEETMDGKRGDGGFTVTRVDQGGAAKSYVPMLTQFEELYG
jgi:hypothetical protein